MVEHSFAGRCSGDVRFKRMTPTLSVCSRGPNMMSYRQIRRDYQSGDLVEPVLVDHYAKLISPIFTNLFFEAGLAPNTVTVLMMCTGFVGAALFAMPLLGLKACGVFFIHTWYVLDCSDGEVARITKRFSKFGNEIDYTAHMVNHPLFNLAFVWSLIGLDRWNSRLILLVAIFAISAELVLRNLCVFHYIYDSKVGTNAAAVRTHRSFLNNLASCVVGFFSIYPNFVLVFPLTYFVDFFLGTSLSFYYLLIQTIVSSLSAVRTSYKWVSAIVSL